MCLEVPFRRNVVSTSLLILVVFSATGAAKDQAQFVRKRIAEVLITGVLIIMSGHFFLFLNKNIYCYSSLEPSARDGSNEG